MNDEEYELVPLSPIRRMEKRLERLEKSGTSNEIMKELIDIVKTNQQIVDDVVRINSEMIKRVGELSETVGKAIGKLDEFTSRIEMAEGEKQEPEQNTEMQAKLDRMEKRINTLLASAQRRPATAARPMARPMMARRPLAPNI